MSDAGTLEALAELASFGTATIGEVAPDARILAPGLPPVRPGTMMAGRAVTVRCRPGDNLALHLAIARLSEADVLVIDYADDLGSGPFGEVMALACQLRGAAGMVTNGAVRDTAQIRRLGFPVFARGIAIRGTRKTDRGQMHVPVELAGVRIADGDIVVGDDDALLVLASDRLGAVLEAARARRAAEEDMMERLRAGETTLGIMRLEGSN